MTQKKNINLTSTMYKIFKILINFFNIKVSSILIISKTDNYASILTLFEWILDYTLIHVTIKLHSMINLVILLTSFSYQIKTANWNLKNTASITRLESKSTLLDIGFCNDLNNFNCAILFSEIPKGPRQSNLLASCRTHQLITRYKNYKKFLLLLLQIIFSLKFWKIFFLI